MNLRRDSPPVPHDQRDEAMKPQKTKTLTKYDQGKFHLLAVNVAADLSDVRERGDEIALSAQNAKVLVARAGSSALGFRPITDFMINLASDTAGLVNKIDQEALAVSRLAVNRLRTIGAVNTARKAVSLAENSGAKYAHILRNYAERMEASDRAIIENLQHHNNFLVRLLTEISSLMLAAKAMASSAKIEAAGLEPQNQAAFLSVAEKLEDCATTIRDKVGENLSLIKLAITEQRNQA